MVTLLKFYDIYMTTKKRLCHIFVIFLSYIFHIAVIKASCQL